MRWLAASVWIFFCGILQLLVLEACVMHEEPPPESQYGYYRHYYYGDPYTEWGQTDTSRNGQIKAP